MFRFVREKIEFIKKWYSNLSPKKKWALVRDLGTMFLRLSGVPILDPNFKVYWWSYAAGIVIIDVSISFAYTIWYYLWVVHDPVKGLLNTPLYFGILVPVSMTFL